MPIFLKLIFQNFCQLVLDLLYFRYERRGYITFEEVALAEPIVANMAAITRPGLRCVK